MTDTQTQVVTGASGFIGRYLVRAMLARGDRVWALIRPTETQSAHERLLEIFGHTYGDQLRLLEGDVVFPEMGISREALRALQAHRFTVWHLAADLSFLQSREEDAVWTNEVGTEHVVNFANQYADRLVYMSTAYVCGDASDVVREELRPEPVFRNYYERSKYHAEVSVRERSTVPFVIFRPSIVIGDAYEGKAEGCTFGYYRFAFMLHTFRAWVKGKLERRSWVGFVMKLLGATDDGVHVHVPWLFVPYPSDGVVDMVSIDYVVDTMLAVIEKPKAWLSHTFHVTQVQPVESLFVMQVAMKDMGVLGARYIRVSPWLFRALLGAFYMCAVPLRKYMKSVYWYVPYVVRPYHFDRAHSDALGIEPPPPITEDFLHRVNAYAKEKVFAGLRIEKLH